MLEKLRNYILLTIRSPREARTRLANKVLRLVYTYKEKKEINFIEKHISQFTVKYTFFDYSSSIGCGYLINHVRHVKVGDKCPYFVPEGALSEGGVCYSFGAGLEISFEVDMFAKYGSLVFLYDPSNTSEKYVRDFISNTKQGKSTYYIQNEYCKRYYECGMDDLDKFKYSKIGLSAENEVKRFNFVTEDSMSYKKQWRKIKDGYDCGTKTLKTLMKENNHKDIDILKMDIEGAEYEVVDNILKEKIFPKIILCELHMLDIIGGKKNFKNLILKLIKNGYLLTFNRKNEFTFVRKDFYIDLYKKNNGIVEK